MTENNHDRTVQLNPEKLLGFRHIMSSDGQGGGSQQLGVSSRDLNHRVFSKLGGDEVPGPFSSEPAGVSRHDLNHRAFSKLADEVPAGGGE